MRKNANSGYVGYSRSVRSQRAIEEYEVPLSHINRALIDDFLHDNEEEYRQYFSMLENISVAKWKFVATEVVGRTSWHHTSSYFNKTDHFCLFEVAEAIIDMGIEVLDSSYRKYRERKSNKKLDNVVYGVMEVEIWDNSRRRRPRLIGHEIIAGIIDGDWLYYKPEHDRHRKTRRAKTSANRVVWLEQYESYEQLIKDYKEFKHTKRVFNTLVKERHA